MFDIPDDFADRYVGAVFSSTLGAVGKPTFMQYKRKARIKMSGDNRAPHKTEIPRREDEVHPVQRDRSNASKH
jgi:hypothetical protein